MEGELKRRRSLLRRGSSRRKVGIRKMEANVSGLRPSSHLPDSAYGDGDNAGEPKRRNDVECGAGWRVKTRKEGRSRLVAVKMTERNACERDTRTRVSFVREVEVLRVSISSCSVR